MVRDRGEQKVFQGTIHSSELPLDRKGCNASLGAMLLEHLHYSIAAIPLWSTKLTENFS